MPKQNVEPIRRRKGAAKRNSLANIYQVLSRNVGQRWRDVKASIYDHPKLQDPRIRPAIRERLDTLLVPRRREPRSHHVFRVNRKGFLERIDHDEASTVTAAAA